MKGQISSPNNIFLSKLPKVPPAARAELTSDPRAAWISHALGQKQLHGTALPLASVPKGGLFTDPEPRPQWPSIPQSPDLHVPTGSTPWIVALISGLSTLQFTSTNDTAPLLTGLGLLRTLKGTRPQDGWGQAVGCRAGSDGSVRGAHLQRRPRSRNPAATGLNEAAAGKQLPKIQEGWKIPRVNPQPAACPSLGAIFSLRLHGPQTGTPQTAVWPHRWLAALDGQRCLAAGDISTRGHSEQGSTSPGTAAPAWARPPPEAAHSRTAWRNGSFSAKPKTSFGFWMVTTLTQHRSPCRLWASSSLAVPLPKKPSNRCTGLCIM